MDPLRERLEKSAVHLETIGDPSAIFVRALATRSEIEDRHDAAVEQMLARARHLAGGQIASRAAEELPGAIDRLTVQQWWRNAAIAAALMLVCTGVADWYGYRSGYDNGSERAVHLEAALGKALTADEAGGWLRVITLNPEGLAYDRCWDAEGHRACSFSLWVEPSPTPPPDPKQASLQQPTKPKGQH